MDTALEDRFKKIVSEDHGKVDVNWRALVQLQHEGDETFQPLYQKTIEFLKERGVLKTQIDVESLCIHYDHWKLLNPKIGDQYFYFERYEDAIKYAREFFFDVGYPINVSQVAERIQKGKSI